MELRWQNHLAGDEDIVVGPDSVEASVETRETRPVVVFPTATAGACRDFVAEMRQGHLREGADASMVLRGWFDKRGFGRSGRHFASRH